MAPPIQTIRWSIARAGKEFGMDAETLQGRVKTSGIVQGEDGKFSTKQIVDAIFGDLDGEKLLKLRAERKAIERDNAREDRILLPTSELLRVWSSILLDYRQRVLYADIPQLLKEDLLSALTEPKIDEYFRTANQDSEGTDSESSGAS
jgi:hypothetical protein